MRQELATLETLRQVANKHVLDFQQELAGPSDKQTLADRVKSVASLRTLVKIIEEIAELEQKFERSDAYADDSKIDSEQRRDLAKRIEALRRRD